MENEFQAVQKFIEMMIEFCVKYSFSVLGAVIILIIGSLVSRQLAGLVARMLEKKGVDVTLTKFASGLVKMILFAFALIIALGKFGITIAPFIAAIGALAFGASFAFQGPLSNYGAGLSIILSRPFTVGDTVTIQGQSGVVQEIKLAMTILMTEDGARITIPNKHIVGEILVNSKAFRVIDTTVGVSYSSDTDKAVSVIRSVLETVPEVSKDTAPQIGIHDFGDSSVNIKLRYWVPTQKYYSTLFVVNKAVFKALGEAGIAIPFPQRDIHIVSGAVQAASGK